MATLTLAFTATATTALLYRKALDEIGPLSLDQTQQLSAVVVDRDGKLLRPFTTSDGRWRLPVETGDVDPRYLKMLFAFEDRRFYKHGGVDPRAVTRAGLQMLRHGRLVSGASTLTMQVARLVEGKHERTGSGKLRQIGARLAARRITCRRTRSCGSTCAWHPSAATSRACARPRSPISARSRAACRSRKRRCSSRFRSRPKCAGPTAIRTRQSGRATGCSASRSRAGVISKAEAEKARDERMPVARLRISQACAAPRRRRSRR